MNGVLGSYLRKRVAGQILALLLALTALIQLLELLEVSTEVLDRGLGVAGVLRYAALRIPAQMELSLPLAGLLGSMATFHAMARTREITALRSAGIGLGRLTAYLWPVPLLFALLHLALAQQIVPAAEGALKTWWDDVVPLEEREADPEWVQTSAGIMLFQRRNADGTRLLDVRIFQRDAEGLLALRTRAAEARWQGNDWLLSQVQELSPQQGTVETPAQRRWSSNLRPDDVVRLDAEDPLLSSVELADVLGGERVGTRPRSYYETVLMESFAAPFTVFIMMLLAIPAALVSERGGGGGRMFIALCLGLGFLLTGGIFSALGTSGRIGPVAAAFIAPVAFAVLGLLQLRVSERT